MHELYCPNCNTSSPFNFADYLLMCQFCSATFHLDVTTGNKDIYGDHYIIPNTADPTTIKELSLEWLRRLHHKPNAVESEFFVTDIKGFSIPFWVVSLEAHTLWRGLVKKDGRSLLHNGAGSEYLKESGQFRRSYRWAVSARHNICEHWGMARLHEPKEPISVEWDGFPLDSTLTRGRLTDQADPDAIAYDARETFEFKFANGLPIMGIQVSEEEALRRARAHVELYHHKICTLNVDYLIDHQSELEIAGIQLIHVPFWRVGYIYRPKTVLRHLYKPKPKHLLLDGFEKGVLKGELAMAHQDKIAINATICGAAAFLFFLLGAIWHPAFFFVALFAVIVAIASAYITFYQTGRRSGPAVANDGRSPAFVEV